MLAFVFGSFVVFRLLKLLIVACIGILNPEEAYLASKGYFVFDLYGKEKDTVLNAYRKVGYFQLLLFLAMMSLLQQNSVMFVCVLLISENIINLLFLRGRDNIPKREISFEIVSFATATIAIGFLFYLETVR